jgi:hypothetical protein
MSYTDMLENESDRVSYCDFLYICEINNFLCHRIRKLASVLVILVDAFYINAVSSFICRYVFCLLVRLCAVCHFS